MTNDIRRDGNSDVLSVTSASSRAGLEKGDSMDVEGLDGVLYALHVVDNPTDASELSQSEARELRDVIAATRRRQLSARSTVTTN